MCDGCYKRIDLSFVRTRNTSQVHEATYRLLDALSYCKTNTYHALFFVKGKTLLFMNLYDNVITAV